MILNLGFAKVPFEGPFNFGIALAGIANGLLWTVIFVYIVHVKGPAIYRLGVNEPGQPVGEEFVSACQKSMAVSALWCFLYENYVGIQAGCALNQACFQMFTKDDVTANYITNGSRFAGNMFEHAPVFLVSLWTYTLFVDYESGGWLGFMYILARLLYPFLYMVYGQFDMCFEFITQMHYGVHGVFMLGTFVNACGGGNAFGDFTRDHPFLAALLGFMTGSFGIFPYGNPIGLIYGFLHYKSDHRAKLREGKSGP